MKKFLYLFLIFSFVVLNNSINTLTTNQQISEKTDFLFAESSSVLVKSDYGYCSGILINNNKTVLTAKHCISKNVNDYFVNDVEVNKIYLDSKKDLALLVTKKDIINKTFITIISTEIKKNDFVYYYGYPNNIPTWSFGKINDTNNIILVERYKILFLISNTIECILYSDHGSSGSGVYNKNNELIGVLITSSESHVISNLVRGSDILNFLNSINQLKERK